jgi:LmbE family N-acetylglucosaminyl deacetylase
MKKKINKRILVIAAHPDDEVLGAGGAIAWHAKVNGDDVYVLFLTEGCSTQYVNCEEKIIQKKEEAAKANEILGVKEVFFENFPDMKLDTLPHVNINKSVEKYVNKLWPDIVFTHHPDINKDHVMIFESTMVALRPVPGFYAKKVFLYAPSSSTEWSAPLSGNYFIPNTYYNISETLSYKLRAFDCYQSESREYPHPRSNDAIEIYAKQIGISVGYEAAEHFMLMRSIENG